jgi:hypothetical protein
VEDEEVGHDPTAYDCLHNCYPHLHPQVWRPGIDALGEDEELDSLLMTACTTFSRTFTRRCGGLVLTP